MKQQLKVKKGGNGNVPNFVSKVKVVKPFTPSTNSYQFECELGGDFLNTLAIQVGMGSESSSVTDITDDLKLESFFLQQALASVVAGRGRLESCGRTFNRPPTYHAHLLKTVSHLQRIQKAEESEKKSREASMDAKRQRLLKASAKKVQQETLQERQKSRTADRKKLESITKSSNKNREEDDKFNVETVVEDIISSKNNKVIGGENNKKTKAFASSSSSKTTKPLNKKKFTPNPKRQSKDSKFGFGGKDRKMQKRNSRESVNDMRGFSKANNKSPFGGSSAGAAGVKKPRKSFNDNKKGSRRK